MRISQISSDMCGACANHIGYELLSLRSCQLCEVYSPRFLVASPHINSTKSYGVSAVPRSGRFCARPCKEAQSDGVEWLGNMFSLTSNRHQQLMKSEEGS